MNVQQESWQDMDLVRLPQHLAGHDVPWVTKARQSAFERFAAHGFPTRREEEWKYTDLSAIGKRASLAPDNIPPDPSFEGRLYAWTLSQESTYLMVFVNGHYSSDLSRIGELPAGAGMTSFAELLDDGANLPESFFDQQHEHTILAALNNAFATDGAVLNLAPGTVLDKPIYLLYIASGQSAAIYPRNIVIARDGARATVIEHY